METPALEAIFSSFGLGRDSFIGCVFLCRGFVFFISAFFLNFFLTIFLGPFNSLLSICLVIFFFGIEELTGLGFINRKLIASGTCFTFFFEIVGIVNIAKWMAIETKNERISTLFSFIPFCRKHYCPCPCPSDLIHCRDQDLHPTILIYLHHNLFFLSLSNKWF